MESDEIPECTDNTNRLRPTDEIPEFTDNTNRQRPTDEIPEYTDNTNRDRPKRFKAPTKPLFKMKIGDLLALEHDPDTDKFKFKNQDLDLVMCGGKISDIFRDDNLLFTFEIDDGSGTIPCFHKFKYDRENVLKNISELPTSARFMQTTFCSNVTRTNEETIFNVTNDNTVIRNLEQETGEAFREILTWFQEEIVEKPQPRNVGDFIHVIGYLMYGDDVRKINVVNFRIPTKEEREDMESEIEYLNRHVY